MRNGLTSPILLLLALLLLLGACGEDGAALRRQLAELERQNRADSVMRNDSLAEHLVDYFDRHGTPNERMRAYYMLGRTYYDLGELPHALEVYYQAADCADTTAADCDYRTLSRIHIHAANILMSQLQSRSQLRELRSAEYFGRKAKDTVMIIESIAQQSDAYKLLSRPDSGILLKEKAAALCKRAGNEKRYAQLLGGTIKSLVELNQLTKAKRNIDIYESPLSGYFDEESNIQSGREIYYYSKGMYYLAIGKTDSAEYMFRKELRVGKDLNNQIAGSKGLQEVFKLRKMPDSIAKYADMGYTLNDSAYSLSEMQNIQKLQLSYN